MADYQYFRFTVPAIPIAQPRPRAVSVGGKARVFGAPKTHAVHDFKATVRMAWLKCYQPIDLICGKLLEGPIAVQIVFVLPRPANKIWKKRPMPRIPHTSRPDVDNLTKSLIDALTGQVWRDDAQVYSCSAEKYIAAGDETPHVEVEITCGDLQYRAQSEKLSA